MRAWCLVLALGVALAFVTAGCESETGAGSNATLSLASYSEFDAFVQKSKGKVVVVDFWATWCGPCVKKFPHLVEMHKKYADKGLVCVSISMDKAGPGEDYKAEKVLAFLKQKEATFPNFIVANPVTDEKKIEARFGDYSVIPYMVVFDKAGRRVWDSDPTVTPPKDSAEKLEKLIQDQLAK